MRSYFKHTNGEAFTYNGEDYVGFFHIFNGKAYMDKVHTKNSHELTPKDTFISQFYCNLGDFNTIYTDIDQITDAEYLTRIDILDKTELDRKLYAIDDNNLTCFKGLIAYNPKIYNFEKNKNIFYGIYDPSEGLRKFSSNADPVVHFSEITDWSFLDNVVSATLFIDMDENYKYLSTNGPTINITRDNFVDYTSPPTQSTFQDLHPMPPPLGFAVDHVYTIQSDESESMVYMVKHDRIDVFDSTNFETCETLILTDQIKMNDSVVVDHIWDRFHVTFGDTMSSNDNEGTNVNEPSSVTWDTRFTTMADHDPEFIKFGKSIRVSLSTTRFSKDGKVGSEFIEIYDKSSNDLVNVYPLSGYKDGIGEEVLSIDIRSIDDNILVLCRSSETFYILHIDPTDNTIERKDLRSLNYIGSPYSSPSNFIAPRDGAVRTIDGDNMFRFRHGRFDKRYRYRTNHQNDNIPPEIERNPQMVINSPKYIAKFSEIDSDVFYISTNTEHQTRFLSRPLYPAGRLEQNELLYPLRFTWGEADTPFFKYRGRWSYGTQHPNLYNNIHTLEKIANNRIYSLHHNEGRVYNISQPINDRFLCSVPLNSEKSFKTVGCGESSVGLYLDAVLSTLIRDLLHLYTSAYATFEIHEREIIEHEIAEVVTITNDFYINSNETFNMATFQRIFRKILEIQKMLIPTSV